MLIGRISRENSFLFKDNYAFLFIKKESSVRCFAQENLRVSINGKSSAFQAEAVGSNPTARIMYLWLLIKGLYFKAINRTTDLRRMGAFFVKKKLWGGQPPRMRPTARRGLFILITNLYALLGVTCISVYSEGQTYLSPLQSWELLFIY